SESSRGRRALLLLDNLEHLIDGGAEVVRTLLEKPVGLTILVTSRRRLDLPGEREFPVSPLEVPVLPVQSRKILKGDQDWLTALLQGPSVALFVDRAQSARAGFQMTADNAGTVASLCRRLEGLPLAIVLAAARANVLTPQQTLERLEQRFELLA